VVFSVIPGYARVLTAAYEKMSRNDYLLTAAILCQRHVKSSKVNARDDIVKLKFDRYACNLVALIPGVIYYHDFSIDSSRVAAWVTIGGDDEEYNGRKLVVVPDVERIVFAALGLLESDFEEFVAQEETRRKSLVMDLKSDATLPSVEVVSMTL
jgi:hypothetical protein